MGEQFEVEEQKDLRLQEDKIYRAKLTELKRHSFNWTDRKDRDNPGVPIEKTSSTLQWWWEVQDENLRNPETGNLRRVKGECPPKITNLPDNKFRLWASALLCRDIPVGSKIDTDDLLGLQADITIRYRADKKDPTRKYEEVEDVIALQGFAAHDAPPF